MAGFIEAWGCGFEIITDAFKGEDLEVPTLVEEFGGVRVIIKREIFYAMQHGGRIDPKTGRLIKADGKENVTNDVTKNEKVNTVMLAAKFGVVLRTIKRDMKALQDLGLVAHVGPSNGGYWKRLK